MAGLGFDRLHYQLTIFPLPLLALSLPPFTKFDRKCFLPFFLSDEKAGKYLNSQVKSKINKGYNEVAGDGDDGDDDAEEFECDNLCGFEGTFDECATHEQVCPKKTGKKRKVTSAPAPASKRQAKGVLINTKSPQHIPPPKKKSKRNVHCKF